MLTEETLILIATLAATGLLVLGVLDLVWPTAPRIPERPARALPRARAPFEGLLVPRDASRSPLLEPAESPRAVEDSPEIIADAPPPAPVLASAPPPVVSMSTVVVEPEPASETPRILVSPTDATESIDVVVEDTCNTVAAQPAAAVPPAASAVRDVAHRPTVGDDDETAATPPPRRDSGAHVDETTAPPPQSRREHVLPIEACTAMFEAGRYADVVSLGSAALELHARLAPVSGRSDEAAALNALVGHAKRHLGDRDGARAAFGRALRAAGPAGRSTYVEHVVEMARDAAGAVSADDTALDVETVAAQARELLESSESVNGALAAVPGDASLEQARTAVRDALATACERLVTGYGAGDGGHQAHPLVLRALADESMPAAWRARLGERLTPISSAEIGQLTAQAIRCVQEGRDDDAVDALRRAERLFAALPAGTVPDERLEEFERRLWWGYTKLGLSRIETRRFEDALEPLFHALTLGGVDADRLGETRGALVGAMESLLDEKSRALSARGADGIPGVDIDKLETLLRSAVDRGVGEDELGDAFAKLLELRQALARAAR